jgi:AcrR family transcriptional regulator
MTHGDRRKAQILEAGLALWPNVTARSIARALDMTHPGVLYHFGSAEKLCEAVAAHAVRTRDARVVPQLIVAHHPAVAGMGAADRADWLSRV